MSWCITFEISGNSWGDLVVLQKVNFDVIFIAEFLWWKIIALIVQQLLHKKNMKSSYLSQCTVQNMLFHIVICFFNIYGYIASSQSDQLLVGLIAELVEYCTGITEIMGFNPAQAWLFFRLLCHSCLSMSLHQSSILLRLLQTFAGVLQKKIHAHAVLKKTPTERL